ncbi:MAG: hypothetical protein IKF91_00180 [Bacilli bacterium]|nr:hypothetical protein [Bacilli bacterium]
MIEALKRQLEEENKRHEEKVKEIERKIKELEEKIKEEKKKTEESEEKIPAVEVNRQDIYFVPQDETNSIERVKVEGKTQNVYFPPMSKIEKKKKPLGLLGAIKQFFIGKEEKKTTIDEIVYTVPQETHSEEINKTKSTMQVYMVPEKDEEKQRKSTNKFDNIIEYAKGIKKDKETHKTLQEKYMNALKASNKDLASKIKDELWESQNKITLAESFLRSEIKEIRRSDLSLEEKTKIINYVCGVAKIKAKDKPEHLKGEIESEKIVSSPIDELNERKEKILSSRHFTEVQKKNMIREIDDQIIELTKDEEKSNKTI